MSSAGRSSQKGRRPSFLDDKGEVRLVENGFDLTPLPLLVDEAPPEEEAVVVEREAHGERALTVPSTFAMLAAACSSDGEPAEDGEAARLG